jgi:hypothetical protein
MVPSGIICILPYADYTVLIRKNEIEIRKLFEEMNNISRKLGLQTNQEKKPPYFLAHKMQFSSRKM